MQLPTLDCGATAWVEPGRAACGGTCDEAHTLRRPPSEMHYAAALRHSGSVALSGGHCRWDQVEDGDVGARPRRGLMLSRAGLVWGQHTSQPSTSGGVGHADKCFCVYPSRQLSSFKPARQFAHPGPSRPFLPRQEQACRFSSFASPSSSALLFPA